MPARVRGSGITPPGPGEGRTASAARARSVTSAVSTLALTAYSASW